jgi:hypothetical protein
VVVVRRASSGRDYGFAAAAGAALAGGDRAEALIERGAHAPPQRRADAGRLAALGSGRSARSAGGRIVRTRTVLGLVRSRAAARQRRAVPYRHDARVRAPAHSAAAGARHTPEPVGGLLGGRHDRLVTALGAHAGLPIAEAT